MIVEMLFQLVNSTIQITITATNTKSFNVISIDSVSNDLNIYRLRFNKNYTTIISSAHRSFEKYTQVHQDANLKLIESK
jgi:hypothetical protein